MHDEKIEKRRTVALQHAPLDVGAAYDFLRCPAAGGIDVFIGTTRRWTDGRETALLAYEAYEPMALREMEALLQEAEAGWPVLRACLLHRLGEVPAAEASVVVGIATAHRDAAFAACRFVIDALKQRVPIWKREVYADGTSEWVRGNVPNV